MKNKLKTAQHSHQQTATSRAIIHLNAYLTEPVIFETNFDPIKYWEEHPCVELREIALKYLPIPGTSVASEALFSAAGYTATNRRNRLSPENLEKILFLNKNLKLL